MKPLSGLNLFLVNVAVSLATFMIVLDYSIANVSIPYIAGDLGVSAEGEGTYVITAFAVGNAISLPITGWLTKRIGAIKLICLSIVLFVFFSWVCGLSWRFDMLVVSRFIQGFVSGPLIPISQTLLVMTNPPEKKNSALAMWSTIVIAAPILGPILGGWISYDYHWPWIFYINIPVGIASAIILWFILNKSETPIQKERLDWVGLSFLAVGVTCLQFLLDKGEQYDWLKSNIIRTASVVSIICFTLLIVWSATTSKPLIQLYLFKIRTYAISVFHIAIAYAIYFGSVVLVPLWLQESMNYTSIWAGWAVAPVGIAPLFFSVFIPKLLKRFGAPILLSLCFIIFAFSCFYTVYFLDTDVDFFHIAFSRFLLGCGMGFFITPLFAMSVQDVPTESLANSTGIFHFVRALFGGIGTSVFTTMWERRSEYHHAIVGENVTAFSQQTTLFLDQLGELGLQGKQALGQMNVLLGQQADVLSINDCFYFMGWLFLALLLSIPFCWTKKKKNTAPVEVHVSE